MSDQTLEKTTIDVHAENNQEQLDELRPCDASPGALSRPTVQASSGSTFS